ncbi:hypothetical protein CAPTEDRAFT_211436 [Capitella teleta]|uniref:Uncharacterized protein n=1 Tax=Capitella teleta TaxID=283909 RepID=R7T6T1_CAPTE|nr:hypothetical protein CAPTEDRAFT_211436 [Capitella teleta]|eukprot:ELT89284.1 hypothetical protein CAPTEDRAFT_211436 [Capitella teleta]
MLLSMRPWNIHPHNSSSTAHQTYYSSRIKPQKNTHMMQKIHQRQTVQNYDQCTTVKNKKQLQINHRIRFQSPKGEWTPGTVIRKATGPRSYIVQNDAGKQYTRNRQQIFTTSEPVSDEDICTDDAKPPPVAQQPPCAPPGDTKRSWTRSIYTNTRISDNVH